MSSNPYQAEPQRIATVQKKDNTWSIILIVVGVMLPLTLLTCGGLAVFGVVAAKRAMNESSAPRQDEPWSYPTTRRTVS